MASSRVFLHFRSTLSRRVLLNGGRLGLRVSQNFTADRTFADRRAASVDDFRLSRSPWHLGPCDSKAFSTAESTVSFNGKVKSRKTSSHESFVVRYATSVEDIQFVLKTTQNLGWYLAPGDLDAFFAADHTGFFIGELNGQKISHISMVKYPHMTFVGIYIVEEGYRNTGYGLKTVQYALDSRVQDEIITFASVPEMKYWHVKNGYCEEWVTKQYVFTAANVLAMSNTVSTAIVKPAFEVDFEKLLEYDAICFGGSRASFLRKWIAALPDRISLVASDENENVIGYIVARKVLHSENHYKIGPLFANEYTIATTLLKAATEKITYKYSKEIEMSLAVPTTEHNTPTSKLPEELGAVCNSFFHYMSRPKIPPSVVAGLSKVFAVTTLELG